MMVEVLLFDAKPGGTYEALSYTVHASGRLEIHLADGTVKTWDEDSPWMDVGPAGGFRPNPGRRPPSPPTVS
jgi:hypothetical protein